MNHKVLLGSVAGIAVLLFVSYNILNLTKTTGNVPEADPLSREEQRDVVTQPDTVAPNAEERGEEVVIQDEGERGEENTEPGPTNIATLPPAQTPPSQTAPTTQAPTPAPSGYTLAEVATHRDALSCWTVIGESVYDVTSFIGKHPGGESKILQICGKDGSSLFEGQHGGDTKPENTLAKFRVGAYLK